MTITRSYPSQIELERQLPEEDRMMYACSAPYVTYRAALKTGLITQEQHDAAERGHGRLWNYCGD